MKIDKDVPLPKTRGAFQQILAKMGVGDSVFCEGQKDSQGHAGQACVQFGKKENRQYSCRKVPGGVRVWRVS